MLSGKLNITRDRLLDYRKPIRKIKRNLIIDFNIKLNSCNMFQQNLMLTITMINFGFHITCTYSI